ncbi:MAG: hypothetical protein VX523_02660 [Chloroflexota bacterium]|nr:hypothetical protein [Chloroflexota bacterium]
MKPYEKEAIDAALNWNEQGFNKRDKKITIQGLHFPHIRLWQNKFSVFRDEKEFLEGYDIQTKKLKKEGWDHTVTLDIKAVQSEKEKVHLLLHQSRRNKNGEEYHNFQTLWILTKIEGRWGIQFRSSFLEGASQISEIVI